MLDLKAKLAAAGLVDAADIAAAERKQQPRGKSPVRPGERRAEAPKPARTGLDVPALRKAGKGEVYDAVRRAVDRGRLDGGAPADGAEAFHFTTAQGGLTRLLLAPAIHQGVQSGAAGIVAFMSHHGLAHAAVPRPLAEAIAELQPFWLRVLKDHPAAGQREPPREPRERRDGGEPGERRDGGEPGAPTGPEDPPRDG